MKKSCPRCREVFECMARSDMRCFCTGISLEQETLHYLAKTNYDCLCNQCLEELNSLVVKVRGIDFDPRISQLREGEYYYYEKGRVVLTELYHIAKGSCCQSGCRHCAYGYHLK